MNEGKQRNGGAAPVTGSILGSAFIREAELLIGAQGELLSNVENAVGNWVRRQREALDSSSRSIQRLYECRNLIDLMQVQQQFVTECLHWTAAEMRALGSDAAAVTRTAAARAGDIAGAAGEEARHVARAAREGTHSRPQHERAAAE